MKLTSFTVIVAALVKLHVICGIAKTRRERK
jgi:hypothetical protein